MRTSFSQNNMFHKCARQWFYQYVLKLPSVQDTTYADAGNVIHKTIQFYYDTKQSSDAVLAQFKTLWQQYKLDRSSISHKEEEYLSMVKNAMALNLPHTSTEQMIFFPDVVAYIDLLDTTNDAIVDWKSSTRRQENEEEYSLQLKFYAYLYQRKFGKMPKRCTVYYLKYTGEQQILSFTPTQADIAFAEKWHVDIQHAMEEIVKRNEAPPKCASCNPWCPFTEVCADSGNTYKARLHITGEKVMLEAETTPLLHNHLDKKFSYTLKNAHWIQKTHPQFDGKVHFWNKRHNTLPIGFLEAFKKTLSDYAEHNKKTLDLQIVDRRKPFEQKVVMPEALIDKSLYDYQLKAVDSFLKYKIGILELATGAGKTVVAGELIRQLRTRTLFVVNTIELLNQTKTRMEAMLGIKVGVIGKGIRDPQDVTVGTLQTLSKHAMELQPYFDSVQFVIWDEAHHMSCDTARKISMRLHNIHHSCGLSGTAKRDDGDDMKMNAVTGYIIHKITSKELVASGHLTQPRIVFVEYDMHNLPEIPAYHDMYAERIVKNVERNMLIKKIVDAHSTEKTLILTKIVEHGQMLHDALPGSVYIHGSVDKNKREQMFQDFKDGKTNLLIGTMSIFAEGIDIPDLTMIINAGANRGDVKTIQVLGRVLRRIAGKTKALYIDFNDAGKFFKPAARQRIRALQAQGYEVEQISVDELNEVLV